MSIKKFLKKCGDNFNLNGINPSLFWKSQITLATQEDFDFGTSESPVSILFFIYRCVFAAYFITTELIIVGCAGDEKRPYWLIFLTNWTYTLQTFYAILSLSVLIKQKWFAKRDPKAGGDSLFVTHNPKLPFLEKLTWIIFNIVNSIPYGVTLVFWIILYPSIKEEWLGSANQCQLISNHFAHSFNSLLALLDLFVVAIPVRITHFVFGVVYLFVYLLFSILYEVGGGDYPFGFDYIYPPLNWKHEPGVAVAFSVASLFLFTLCHFIFAWGLVRIRTYVARVISELMGKYSFRLETC